MLDFEFILYIAIFINICGFAFVSFLILFYSPKPRKPLNSEKYYQSAHHDKPQKLKSIFDNPSVELSVVVPAYNESKRLPEMLEEAIEFLEQKRVSDKNFSYEILVVDDGSQDDTTDVALKIGKKHLNIDLKVLRLEKNRKKGGAVTQGVLSASGKYVLFADADGATKFSDLEILEKGTKKIVNDDGFGVGVGSRSHLVNTDAVVKGWIFDIEVLLIANYLKIPIIEVPVNWKEIDGSKVSLIKDSLFMALDLLVIRLNYWLRFWKIKDPHLLKLKSE
ncbi:2669_t:CDS:2 [Entrophospora sp. SA101]|nr:2669_t:CDS:2 [Entrophospora sp. SA101]CAJ0829390.1 3485_t:CDS:2 [Entrophospora sp. SA101]CAJ0918997.1 11386_t:CDS:2 [Entrophospora sp. SA101]